MVPLARGEKLGDTENLRLALLKIQQALLKFHVECDSRDLQAPISSLVDSLWEHITAVRDLM
jgi:hypothetical protein